jgi:poly-gamma-glutamate capsule biosynthesis protein CapA/YwtB (metallophosphatase superfamily)
MINPLWSAERNSTIQITAVGDIMMGSTYPTPILPPEDGQTLFNQVKEAIKGGHVTLGNLEGPLIDSGYPHKCNKEKKGQWGCFEFRTPTRYAKYLTEAGFNALCISNNHSLDFGKEGLASTNGLLRAQGIAVVGDNSQGTFFVNNKQITVVGFSFMDSDDWPSISSVDRTMEVIANLKRLSDIVVVSFHGGAEGAGALHIRDSIERLGTENRGNVVRFARSAIDAGADIVIGHGPHVLRAMELYRGKLIAYSLGNFVTYGRFNTNGPNGISVILKANIDETTGNFVFGQIVPIKLRDGGIPYLDEEGESIRLIKLLSESDVPSSLHITGVGNILPTRQKP